jgi:predicted amidohydrolase YtcJ
VRWLGWHRSEACKRGRGGLLALLLLALTACGERPGGQAGPEAAAVAPAELAFLNGGIYTVDPQRRWVEAAAVRDGAFVAVGTNHEIEALIGPQTRVIDLSGRMALPGFHDAHVHPDLGGDQLMACDVQLLRSVDAIKERLNACAVERDEGWLEGFGLDLSLFGENGPHKSILDGISSTRPVIVWGEDGHSVWVNSVALELAGITTGTPDPPLGVIERDADGSPSGTLRETAQEIVRAARPAHTHEHNVAALRAAIAQLNAFGITSYIDAWVGLEDYRAYQEIDRAGELTARVVTSLTYESGFAKHYGDEWEQVLAGRNEFESERLNHDSVKLFLDGVLEGETAALIEPYLGMHGKRGDLILEPDVLNAAVTRFDAMGLQVHMHAIGDRAVRAGLDAIEAARKANGPSDNRHHISHLQMIHVDDIERFAGLDTAANFQALWAWPDSWIMELNLPVLGEERVQGMYPIGGVARAGGRIVGGSDWNVSSPNPLDAIETAIHRHDPLLEEGPVLNAEERVSLELMIDAYTINAAWLMHHEDRVGSIEVGKRADAVVLDRNLFEIPATEISDAQVVMTLLDGETIWSQAAAADTSAQD